MGSVSPSHGLHLPTALAQAHHRYTNVHPLSKKSHEEACEVLPGGNTRTVLHTTPFPLSIVRGESCYLKTADDLTFLDFLNEYTAGIYGHNHPLIRQAIQDALDRGWNYGAHHGAEQKLAQEICKRFPSMDMVRFVNSGTEANMMALATALAKTKKTKILLFDKAYHGSTISGRQSSTKSTINLPHDFVVGRYNDVEGTRKLVASLPPASLAAILVEPMLGSGGCFVGSLDFLTTLRRLADEHDALLIFDEVMTSRIGYHGLGALRGITPDIMTVGKYLGGGMSFGAFGGSKTIMELYDPRTGQLEHPGTFNNNVFSMAAGIAGCQLLTKGKLQQLDDLGNQIRGDIESLISSYGIQGILPDSPLTDERIHLGTHPQRPPKMFVRGIGSLMCIHFAGPDSEMLAGLFFHHMLEQGIYLAQRGFIALSIELNTEHAAALVSAVSKFCHQFKKSLIW